MRAVVVHNGNVQWTELGAGVSRKVLSYDERMMVVEVRFEENGVGSPHSHPHAQSTYVASGSFRFTVDGAEVDVETGDSITFEPDAVHATLCLKAGTLIDVFAPLREDFI